MVTIISSNGTEEYSYTPPTIPPYPDGEYDSEGQAKILIQALGENRTDIVTAQAKVQQALIDMAELAIDQSPEITTAYSDLVGYWKFDKGSGNTATDYSANGNDGAINGATWVDGKYRKALSFDGDSDYVQISYLEIFNQKPFTVAGWIYQDTLKENEILLSCGDGGLTADPAWTDRHLHLVVRNGYPHFGFFFDDLSSATYLETGKWWHLAFVWEGPTTKKQRIYINGSLDSERTSDGLLTVTSGAISGNSVWIGRYQNAWYHDGLVDEVLIFDRALSENKISEIYQSELFSDLNGLTATAGDGKITLSWNSISDASGYNIYVSTTSGSGFAKANSVLITSTTYTVTNLTNSTIYYFYVTYMKDGVESEASIEVSATPTEEEGGGIDTSIVLSDEDTRFAIGYINTYMKESARGLILSNEMLDNLLDLEDFTSAASASRGSIYSSNLRTEAFDAIVEIFYKDTPELM